ncbi:MAG: 4Fe-4S dicluster domain-containing protein [Gemmatimonadetes bacterium]|nr:4Fe-4S dicluster domain-containing protein [Gemmatimonadota bacterium]
MTLQETEVAPARYVLTFDAEICRWCSACELVCSIHHEGVFQPSASRIRMLLDQFEARMTVAMCRQCRNPRCLFACPENAIVADETTGARLIVAERCTACGLCVEACPFDDADLILRHDEAAGTYVKCDMCGGDPRCVNVCPTGALKVLAVRRK